MERAVILVADGRPIDVAHLFSLPGDPGLPTYGLAPDGRLTLGAAADDGRTDTLVRELLQAPFSIGHLETRLIAASVARADGNLTLAAQNLGLTRAQLAYRHRQSLKTAPHGAS